MLFRVGSPWGGQKDAKSSVFYVFFREGAQSNLFFSSRFCTCFRRLKVDQKTNAFKKKTPPKAARERKTALLKNLCFLKGKHTYLGPEVLGERKKTTSVCETAPRETLRKTQKKHIFC